jgi:hypothetical protein
MIPIRPAFIQAAICAIGISLFPGYAGDRVVKMMFLTDTIITSNIEIPPGVTCVIKPGIHIRFEGYRTLTVRGLLVAEGTTADPIVFSPVNRPKSLQEDPAWKGIEIIGGKANARFKHCRFLDAYRNLVWESSPSFDSCEFVGNHYALYCSKKASPLVSHCEIHHNTYGIAVDLSYPLLLYNSITGNVIGLYLQLTAETIAGKNLIKNNETNIHIEKAFGGDSASFHLQSLWDVMQQLY